MSSCCKLFRALDCVALARKGAEFASWAKCCVELCVQTFAVPELGWGSRTFGFAVFSLGNSLCIRSFKGLWWFF